MVMSMNDLVSKRVPNAETFLVHCERITMKSKAVVFRQGDPSEDLYLILDGSVSVIVDDSEAPDQEMVVSYLNPGEFFGEMGLFDEESRTANPVIELPANLQKLATTIFTPSANVSPTFCTHLPRRLGNVSRIRLESLLISPSLTSTDGFIARSYN